MVFSSHLFLFYFLPLALLVYYLLPGRGRLLGLTLLSYLFYGWANPAFVLLMLASTGIDYVCARIIDHPTYLDRPRIRRLAVTASVVANLSLLGFFKYFNFAVDTLAAGLAAVGLPQPPLETAIRVTLPLGISFYTFQSMSYTLDVYRGRVAARRNLIELAAYVSMFPQLVAGPIVRFNEVADQLRERRHTAAKFARGAGFVILGLSKKVLLANPCGEVADVAFAAGSLAPLDAWYGVIAYAFQIYFDFSGYSDMAIGLALMIGFVLPKNFDAPYAATSITDFWRRWHLSLSTWLRDYLYVPLGGNRRGRRQTYVNLFVVMLLGGLWHGAAWNFVLWGALHGLLLAIERARGRRPLYSGLPHGLQVACTFLVVCLGWVLFRADSLPHALRYFGSLFAINPATPAADLLPALLYTPYSAGCVLLAALVAWGCPQTDVWTRRLTLSKGLVLLVLFWIAILFLETQGYNPFIYFIF